MIRYDIKDFTGGWFVGSFQPTALVCEAAEFGVKAFRSGTTEPAHYQRVATEVSVVISGECRIGLIDLQEGDILVVFPGEVTDFEAKTDCILAVCKVPSVPNDKVVMEPA